MQVFGDTSDETKIKNIKKEAAQKFKEQMNSF